MVDIHTHILPGIDDGARDLQEALALLAMEQATGVSRIFLTPHYNPEKTAPEAFLSAREDAWLRLTAALDPQTAPQLRLGAEVRFCPPLLDMDLKPLTLGGSDYLLLELAGQSCPPYLPQVTEQFLQKGIVPVFAHVERYAFFRQNPSLLKRLTALGALAQISAGALFDRQDQRFSQACLQHNLAQVVASDAHRTTGRKPCMDLLRRLSEEVQELHRTFSESVWENEVVPYTHISTVKKTFWGYR